ncbi:MAG: MFS transporter [Candidatus Parcubacteria bacterium]|nr:MFS transporter [Candidatus Parcubacteria bacterium]
MEHNRKIIYWAGFIFSLPIALMSYINSSFISSFIDEKYVGAIYALGSIVSIITLLVINKTFSELGGYKFLLWVIGLDALAILLFAFSKSAWQAIILFISIFTLNILIIFSLDELLKIFSKDSTTGKIRGSYLTFANIAWIIAQLSLGTFLGDFSFKMIYLTGFVLMVLFFAITYLRLKNIPDPHYDKKNVKKYIKEFFKNKNLFRVYSLSFLLQFFYSWMVIYTPIYLSIHLGFAWQEIGIIFAIMLLPFVIIPLPLGKYSDKIGERKMLMLGFTIASLATLSLFFIRAHYIWLWAVLLFTTRVGAASIEVMNDVYFFKHIKIENEEYVGVYRSTAPVAYIIGPLSAFFVFLFIPSFNFIYLILGAIMLGGVYISSTIKKSDI